MSEQEKIKVVLSVSPSFSDRFYWEIDFSLNHNRYVVQEFKERKKQLARKATLDTDILIIWMSRVQGLSVPLEIEDTTGFGRVTYSFSYTIGSQEIHLSWGSNKPKKWKPIIDWFHEFVAWLKSELDKMNRLQL